MRAWEKLQNWLNEEAQSARIFSRLVETALLHEEGKAELLRDPELAIVWDWKNQNKHNAAWGERYSLDFQKAFLFLEESIAVRYENSQNRIKDQIAQQIESGGHFDVFLSYSRRDTEFTKTLYSELVKNGYHVWVDWQSIPVTSDWSAEVEEGISSSDNLIFVISPDSVKSSYCNSDIENAAKYNKRIIPILLRSVQGSEIHPVLQKTQWLDFRDTTDVASSIKDLIRTLNTDLEHVKTHTRLAVRALEWNQNSRDSSLLLRGLELGEAERWLFHAAGKEPSPTELQREYFQASAKARQAMNNRQRRTLAVLSVLSMLASGAGIFAYFQAVNAQEALKGQEAAIRIIEEQRMEIELLKQQIEDLQNQ